MRSSPADPALETGLLWKCEMRDLDTISSLWGFLETPAEGGDLVSMVTSGYAYLRVNSSRRAGNLSIG